VSRRTSRSAVAVGLAGAAVLLAACSSSPTATTVTHPAFTTTTSAPSRTTTTGPVTTTTVPQGATSTTTGTARCPTTGLAASIQGGSGAAGTNEVTMALTNRTSSTCILGGYPGLLMLNAAGAALPTSVVRKGTYGFTAMDPTVVTLTPGGVAYVNLGYSDVPTGTETSCPSSTSLEITPPNATDHLTIAATLAPCGQGTIVVSPVFSATGSNTQFTVPA
jgi:Domain of unknown function (DUF4232)